METRRDHSVDVKTSEYIEPLKRKRALSIHQAMLTVLPRKTHQRIENVHDIFCIRLLLVMKLSCSRHMRAEESSGYIKNYNNIMGTYMYRYYMYVNL